MHFEECFYICLIGKKTHVCTAVACEELLMPDFLGRENIGQTVFFTTGQNSTNLLRDHFSINRWLEELQMLFINGCLHDL